MAILRRDCPHCPVQHVAFEIKWCEHVPNRPHSDWNCAATCGACNRPICFQAIFRHPGLAPPQHHPGNIEDAYVVGPIWPARAPSSAPTHTPPKVASRFIQGENAFRRGDWNAAAAMYRSALDIATKALPDVPKGETFYKRLQWLNDNNRITPDIRAWGDTVRVEGNDALHDEDEFSEADTTPLRFFTEMFLRYVFELPGEVAAFRAEAPPA